PDRSSSEVEGSYRHSEWSAAAQQQAARFSKASAEALKALNAKPAARVAPAAPEAPSQQAERQPSLPAPALFLRFSVRLWVRPWLRYAVLLLRKGQALEAAARLRLQELQELPQRLQFHRPAFDWRLPRA